MKDKSWYNRDEQMKTTVFENREDELLQLELDDLLRFDFNIIWDHACGINHGLYNRKEGLAFYGENGTMVLDRAGWEVIPVVSNNVARMEAVPFKKGEGKGLYNHVGNMLSCIKSRELPNADVAIGARVAKMAHLANISCRVQREVHWDDKNNLFVGDNEATALSKAYYRAPWELPKL